ENVVESHFAGEKLDDRGGSVEELPRRAYEEAPVDNGTRPIRSDASQRVRSPAWPQCWPSWMVGCARAANLQDRRESKSESRRGLPCFQSKPSLPMRFRAKASQR